MKIKYECFDCGKEGFVVETCPSCGSTNTCETDYEGGDFDKIDEGFNEDNLKEGSEEDDDEESDIS